MQVKVVEKVGCLSVALNSGFEVMQSTMNVAIVLIVVDGEMIARRKAKN